MMNRFIGVVVVIEKHCGEIEAHQMDVFARSIHSCLTRWCGGVVVAIWFFTLVVWLHNRGDFGGHG